MNAQLDTKKPAPPVVILCLPGQGEKLKKELAKFYGLDNIKVNWQGTFNLADYSSLYLTERRDVFDSVWAVGVVKTLTIQQAVDEYNAAIPVGAFRTGRPRHVGEYIATVFHHSTPHGWNIRRWWNGRYWSQSYLEKAPQHVRNRAAGQRSPTATIKHTHWCGLSRKPLSID